MNKNNHHPLATKNHELSGSLTPKGKLIQAYLTDNIRKAVFMTARELAHACGTSEATVIRFVARLGYSGYSEMQQALRDFVDAEMTLLDRRDLLRRRGHDIDGFRKTIADEIENLSYLYNTMQTKDLEAAVNLLCEKDSIYAVGSRLSYAIAYYLGWSLVKVRRNVHILKGSDTTTFDRLTVAPEKSLVVVVAMSRYPNELLRVGRWAHRKGLTLMVITDGASCPLIPFSQLSLVAPSRQIPFLGNTTSLSCLVNYLVHEAASQLGESLTAHQEKIEQTYIENDLFFNPTR